MTTAAVCAIVVVGNTPLLTSFRKRKYTGENPRVGPPPRRGRTQRRKGGEKAIQWPSLRV